MIGLTNEIQTLNGRLEEYGKQINRNSQSIANIEKTLYERVNQSNALEMIYIQRNVLENCLSIECREREEVALTNIYEEKGNCVLSFVFTDEHTASTQQCPTSQYHDTESSNTRNIKTVSNVEPPEKRNTDVRGNETTNTEDTGPSNDSHKVATSDVLLPEELVTSEHEDKTSQNMETNSPKNIDGLTASSVDTTEELASSSQDEGTSHLQDTESSNVRNAQTTSSVEPTGKQATDVRGNETSNIEDTGTLNDRDKVTTSDALLSEELAASVQDDGTSQYKDTESSYIRNDQTTSGVEPTEEQVTDIAEDETSNAKDTIPSNDMDEVATSDVSPSVVLPSEDLITTEPEDKPSQNQSTNSPNSIDGPTAPSVDITEELAASSQDEGTSGYQETESSNISDVQSTSNVEPTEEQVTDIAEDETSKTEDTIPSNDMDEVVTSDVSPSVVLPPEDLITTEPGDKTSQNQATNSPNIRNGPTASSIHTNEIPISAVQDNETLRIHNTSPKNVIDGDAASKRLFSECLTFKLEHEISDLYFHERTKFEKKDETTSRIIRREYISSSIRGDFSDFLLLDKSDEEEKYAPRKKQTGNLSHLVGSDSKKLLEKLQSDFDDWEEKNRRRGKFGRRERP
ncbi:hypothetical protein HOLleu_24221 [Holothuria leucospilota]|uniref:Uncharacterized protein n=1 Tax=Holothuria leucospilota TaxID=206669 RepID=A0A9Q1H5B4_HOLLE|nr:hypothetical protein HOLleu_24221 [Holothuria leucospilota]